MIVALPAQAVIAQRKIGRNPIGHVEGRAVFERQLRGAVDLVGRALTNDSRGRGGHRPAHDGAESGPGLVAGRMPLAGEVVESVGDAPGVGGHG